MTKRGSWIGWIALAVIVLILVAASMPQSHIREGEQGSYLGREVADAGVGANHTQDLNQRTMRQRF